MSTSNVWLLCMATPERVRADRLRWPRQRTRRGKVRIRTGHEPVEHKGGRGRLHTQMPPQPGSRILIRWQEPLRGLQLGDQIKQTQQRRRHLPKRDTTLRPKTSSGSRRTSASTSRGTSTSSLSRTCIESIPVTYPEGVTFFQMQRLLRREWHESRSQTGDIVDQPSAIGMRPPYVLQATRFQ